MLTAEYLADRARKLGMPIMPPGQAMPGGTVFAGLFRAQVAIPAALTGTGAAPQVITVLSAPAAWAEDPRMVQAGAVAANPNTLVGFYGARLVVAGATDPAATLTDEDVALLGSLQLQHVNGNDTRYFPLGHEAITKGTVANSLAAAANTGVAPVPGVVWTDTLWANFNNEAVNLVAPVTGALSAALADASRLELFGVVAKSLQLDPAKPCRPLPDRLLPRPRVIGPLK